MPYPSTGNERPRPDLARSLDEIDVVANRNNMVALKVFPVREVPSINGTFPRQTRKQLMAKAAGVPGAAPGFALQRAPRAGYAQDDMAFSEDSWRTVEHGVEGKIDENERAAYTAIQHDLVVTQRLANLLATERELRVSAAVFNTTTFTTGNGRQINAAATPAEQWHNPSTGTPTKHIKNAKLAVFNRTGLVPNAMVLNWIAWLHLINTDEVRARVHGQGAGIADRQRNITEAMVAEIFDLEEIVVAKAVFDAANPNAAYSNACIWGAHASVYVKVDSLDLSQNGIGRTFHWAGDKSTPNGYVEQYYSEEVRGDKIRIRHQEHNKMLDADCAQLIATVYA